MSRTAVLCYSGGLDTTCAICWLKEDYGFDDVVAVLADVGQEFDLEQAIERGDVAGAKEIVVLDLKERFASGIVAQAIKTNALYEGRYPLVSALSRPLIAGAVAEVAVEHQAEALVHGCTGKGNDQLRFDYAFKANYPGVKVIAPLRDQVRTREEEIVYAQERGIPITNTKESPYSIDENLFGRAIESGMLEDPWTAPPEDAYRMTSDPTKAPAPKEIVIGFENGVPVSLDGEKLPLYELIHRMNVEAGAYGIGRIDMIENRAVGIKSREVYEAPGGDRADRGAQGAGGAGADQGRAAAQALPRGALDGDRLRGRWFTPGARGDRRLRRPHPEAGHRRGAAAPAGRPGRRRRTALGERALRRDARLLRGLRHLPARGGRGPDHPPLARDGGRRGPGEKEQLGGRAALV